MSAPAEVACRGAPRDLGLDQGAALRGAIRAEAARACGGALGRALAPLRRTRGERAFARAVRRHQPQLHERLEGMARGARVPVAALLRLLAYELRGSAPDAPDAPLALAAGGEASGGGALLALALPGVRAERLVLRRTEPDAGFAGLEATLPGLPVALAGVNARGLAAAWLAGPPAEPGDEPGAPPALLVQECLERLAGVEDAIERCERRAAAGRATLLFADSGGAVAGVAFRGAERRVLRPEAGVLAAPAAAPRAGALAKRAREAGTLDAAGLAACLGAGGLLLEPGAARLSLVSEGALAPRALRG